MTRPTERSSVASRHFVDCVGVAWSVYCVASPILLPSPTTLLPHVERRGGWLFFESDEGDRRRLAPFPADWREVTPFELERWCMRATPVSSAPARRRGDAPFRGTSR